MLNPEENSLFTPIEKGEDYTSIAIDIDTEIYDAIRPIFKKYADLGYSKRQLAYLINQTVFDIHLQELL